MGGVESFELKLEADIFYPSKDFVEQSNIQAFIKRIGVSEYSELYRRSIQDPAWFWSTFEKDAGFVWFSPYSKVIDDSGGLEWTTWFVDGKFNIAYNCLERQIAKYGPDKIAYICEDEDGEKETVTYGQLNFASNKIANCLRGFGISKGDVVCLFMSNTWRTIAIMLACAKLGAIHCAIFSGLGTAALRSRIENVDPKVIVATHSYYRRGKINSPPDELEKAISEPNNIKAILIDSDSRIGGSLPIKTKMHGIEVFYLQDMLYKESDTFDCEHTSSEDPLFILHTSGTTGTPKAIVHVHAGFAVVSAQQTVHPLDMKANDILFWPTDIGWISAHIWTIYGLLLCGGSAVLYDGALDYPRANRFLNVLSKNRATIIGMSPTLIRQVRQSTRNVISDYDFSMVKIIALTGEPVDKTSWSWLHTTIGHGHAAIFNNSGGTEVGGAILGASPNLPMKIASVGLPQLGFAADVVDDDGNHVEMEPGYLVMRKPWPSMTRAFWKNPKGYLDTYWSRFQGVWYHSDWALIDKDGFWFILGRIDDVIKVAGHRIGATEIEDVLLSHPAVLEAAVVAVPHEIRGQSIIAYIIPKESYTSDNVELLRQTLREYVSQELGKIARPEVRIVKEIPKTPTGKILRRVLRDVQNFE
ncbi:MAG: AMP-binding protein [archaeon]|nr:AMP-binding protein [archaeon]